MLEEALAARVIEELPRALDRYQFTHALIQETLSDELSLTRRVRLHAQVAEALEELYGDQADDHATELAHHFGEAEALLGPEKLVQYSMSAGESALEAHAHEQAWAHFERALAAKGDGAMDDETAALLVGLGRAQVAALERYELEPAVANLSRSFDHYASTGQTDRAVAVASYPVPLSLGLGYLGFPRLIASGLELVSPDSRQAGALLAQQGWISGMIEGDYGAAQGDFDRALRIAQRHGDAALERRTLANSAWIDIWHFHWPESLEKGSRAIELAQQAVDAHTEISARRPVMWALTYKGEGEELRSHTEKQLAIAERLRDRWWVASAFFDKARLAVYEGNWQDARETTDLSSAAQPRDPRPLALRALLEYELGDFTQGATNLEKLCDIAASVPPPGPIAEHAFAAGTTALAEWIAGTEERLEAAGAFAKELLSGPPLAPALLVTASSALALIAVQRDDADAAEGLYAELARHVGGASFMVPIAFDRLLGLLARTFRSREAALTHFEDGLALCSRAGYRPEYAHTACDYAETLLARDAPASHSKVVALQDEALAIARELGMRPLIERILARRELLNA